MKAVALAVILIGVVAPPSRAGSSVRSRPERLRYHHQRARGGRRHRRSDSQRARRADGSPAGSRGADRCRGALCRERSRGSFAAWRRARPASRAARRRRREGRRRSRSACVEAPPSRAGSSTSLAIQLSAHASRPRRAEQPRMRTDVPHPSPRRIPTISGITALAGLAAGTYVVSVTTFRNHGADRLREAGLVRTAHSGRTHPAWRRQPKPRR